MDEKRIVEITKSLLSGKCWERKPVFECDTDDCSVCKHKSDCKWTSLKLGNEISDDYMYRQIFFVYDKGEHNYDYTDSHIDGSVFSGAREECESWIEAEKHKNNWVVSTCEYQASTHFKKNGERSRELNDAILWGWCRAHSELAMALLSEELIERLRKITCDKNDSILTVDDVKNTLVEMGV